MRRQGSSRLWNVQLLTDGANRSLFDLSMSRDAGYLAALRVDPNAVRATLTVGNTRLATEIALQIGKLHSYASSKISRTAPGERSFSASSRWQSSTSLSASRRFALASSSVSPCEIAAGISSTKQVYPPSFAGSNTAVSFTGLGYHSA